VSDFFRHHPARVASRLHVLEPGVYQIQYDQAEDGLHPPRILLHAGDASGDLTFETDLGHVLSQFLNMGEFITCRVKKQTTFLISILSGFGTLSDRVSLSIEPFNKKRTSDLERSTGSETIDVEGPDTSTVELTKIEKIGLFWTEGQSELDLEYSFHIADWGWLPFMRPGSYLSFPSDRQVTGVSFQLIGSLAARYQLLLEIEDDTEKVRRERGHSVLIAPLAAPSWIKKISVKLVLIDPSPHESVQPQLSFRAEMATNP
jgi:hypothetical protein